MASADTTTLKVAVRRECTPTSHDFKEHSSGRLFCTYCGEWREVPSVTISPYTPWKIDWPPYTPTSPYIQPTIYWTTNVSDSAKSYTPCSEGCCNNS